MDTCQKGVLESKIKYRHRVPNFKFPKLNSYRENWFLALDKKHEKNKTRKRDRTLVSFSYLISNLPNSLYYIYLIGMPYPEDEL
jgi:hypothetical protein